MSASALYGFDSFKSGTSIPDLTLGRWNSFYDPYSHISLQTGKGRFGGQSLQMAGFIGNAQNGFTKIIGNQTQLAIHMPFRYDGGLTSNVALCWFADSGTEQIAVRHNVSNGLIEVVRGSSGSGTVLGSGTAILQGCYYVLELFIVFSATVGVVKMNLNGVSIVNLTGQNTSASGNAQANKYSIGQDGGSGASIYGGTYQFEHIICTDDLFATWEKRIYQSLPTSDSSVSWTKSAGATNYGNVNEAQENGDTTYNVSSAPGQVDLFGFPATPSNLNTVFAVIAESWARKDDAGVRQISNHISSSGVTADGATDTLGSSYGEYLDYFYVDPNTSAAWTKAAVDAMLSGYKEIA